MNTKLYNILIHGGVSAAAAYEICKIDTRLTTTELAADTVTAGDPSTYTTSDTYTVSPPKDLTALAEVTADPLTHWVAGDYAVCADGDKGYWDGAKYVEGVSPGFSATGATAGTPGAFTPTGANVPADLAALVALDPTPSPATAWTVGQRVALGTGTAHWNGTAWITGNAPA